MIFTASKISYRDTNSFSRIVNDYLDADRLLKPFYKYLPSKEGILNAIQERKHTPFNRQELVDLIRQQYAGKTISEKLSGNINDLLSEDCFTITTAHQPNIFTGHLYFIYKIVHVIRLADDLRQMIPGKKFVPVYYMGSEDADLAELGEIIVGGKSYKWDTKQTGAVGRMIIDKHLLKLIDELENHLGVEPHGKEIITFIRKSYKEGETIEQATFHLVNSLFGNYGLVILLPDSAGFKKKFISVLKKELEEQFSSPAVNATIESFPAEYKVQAAGRELNLFYLKDNIRERIERQHDSWKVLNTSIQFNSDELEKELNDHPERFSPNVILRPVFQEHILPNVAFIGGGGELAYWLELQRVFEAVAVPFPVLVLRNSFAITDETTHRLVSKLKLSLHDLFKKEKDLVDMFVKRESSLKLDLAAEKKLVENIYQQMLQRSSAVDPGLEKHVLNLRSKAIQKIDQLEKKMLNAEKKKFEASLRQVHKIREKLYPSGTLQERVDNLLPYYAKWGSQFIREIYDHSEAFSTSFTVLSEE